MLQDELKEIRTQLRMAMNGVIATSMREKGIDYKLNFGVPLPEIKQIAARHEPGSELAAALWKEDIREFKILASLLQPVDDFPFKQAEQWVKKIPYLEIAEQCSRNLFCKLPYVDNLLLWTDFLMWKTNMPVRWLTLSGWNCSGVGKTVVAPVRAAFIVECMRTIAWPDFGASGKEKQAAIKSNEILRSPVGRSCEDKC